MRDIYPNVWACWYGREYVIDSELNKVVLTYLSRLRAKIYEWMMKSPIFKLNITDTDGYYLVYYGYIRANKLYSDPTPFDMTNVVYNYQLKSTKESQMQTFVRFFEMFGTPFSSLSPRGRVKYLFIGNSLDYEIL